MRDAPSIEEFTSDKVDALTDWLLDEVGAEPAGIASIRSSRSRSRPPKDSSPPSSIMASRPERTSSALAPSDNVNRPSTSLSCSTDSSFPSSTSSIASEDLFYNPLKDPGVSEELKREYVRMGIPYPLLQVDPHETALLSFPPVAPFANNGLRPDSFTLPPQLRKSTPPPPPLPLSAPPSPSPQEHFPRIRAQSSNMSLWVALPDRPLTPSSLPPLPISIPTSPTSIKLIVSDAEGGKEEPEDDIEEEDRSATPLPRNRSGSLTPQNSSPALSTKASALSNSATSMSVSTSASSLRTSSIKTTATSARPSLSQSKDNASHRSIGQQHPFPPSSPITFATTSSAIESAVLASPMKTLLERGRHFTHFHSPLPRHAVITGRNFDVLNEDLLKEWLERETCGKVLEILHVTNDDNVYPEWHVSIKKVCQFSSLANLHKAKRITVPSIGLITIGWSEEPLPRPKPKAVTKPPPVTFPRILVPPPTPDSILPPQQPRPRRKSLPRRIYESSIKPLRC